MIKRDGCRVIDTLHIAQRNVRMTQLAVIPPAPFWESALVHKLLDWHAASDTTKRTTLSLKLPGWPCLCYQDNSYLAGIVLLASVASPSPQLRGFQEVEAFPPFGCLPETHQLLRFGFFLWSSDERCVVSFFTCSWATSWTLKVFDTLLINSLPPTTKYFGYRR